MNDPKNATSSAADRPVYIDLESLGLSEVAYLRKATVDGIDGYSIHAANGIAIGFAPEENSAIAAVMTNDLELAPVH